MPSRSAAACLVSPAHPYSADLTTFDPAEMNAADLDSITALLSGRIVKIARRRQAIVASLGWELARAFELRLQRLGATTVVFNSVTDACTWLGADLDSTREIVGRLRGDCAADLSGSTDSTRHEYADPGAGGGSAWGQSGNGVPARGPG